MQKKLLKTIFFSLLTLNLVSCSQEKIASQPEEKKEFVYEDRIETYQDDLYDYEPTDSISQDSDD